MKQFNLEEYLKNPDRQIITKDGRNVRIICTDARGNFPIIALVETDNGNETVLRLKENGRFYNDTENSSDLFFATKKKNGWVNIYEADGKEKLRTSCRVYKTLDKALKEKEAHCDDEYYLKTIKISW